MTKVSIDDLPQYLATSITDSFLAEGHFFASISSSTDTIRYKTFGIIGDFFKSKNIRKYVIRNWTEEERLVIEAKVENKQYNPDSVVWKIGFDTIFVPPKDTANTE